MGSVWLESDFDIIVCGTGIVEAKVSTWGGGGKIGKFMKQKQKTNQLKTKEISMKNIGVKES